MRGDAPDGELVSLTFVNVLKWLDEREAEGGRKNAESRTQNAESGSQNADVLVVAEVSVS